MKKIAILYTRLTGYWMACMRHDQRRTGNEYLVFRQRTNPEAPFQLHSEIGIRIENEEDFDDINFLKKIVDFQPDIIYVAGWNNKKYLNIAKKFKRTGIPVITGMDNHWKATIKQKVACLISSFLIHPYFTDIWIPGSPQLPFAKKLGFDDNRIHEGLYCADESLFQLNEKKSYSKDIIFVGRLVDHKGLGELLEVINELIANDQLNLKFHFIGNGPFADLIPKHPTIKHTPFVVPESLPELLQTAGFLILPSNYEAWGLVVHEALLCGLPVISTYQCGAAIDFIEEGKNGFLFKAGDKSALKGIFRKINEINESKYQKMSESALKSASKITLDNWSKTINSFAE